MRHDLHFPTEFKTGIFNGGFQSSLVNGAFNDEFFLCDISHRKYNAIQCKHSLFNTGLAMATIHPKNFVGFRLRFSAMFLGLRVG